MNDSAQDSRRSFLKSVAATSAASTVATTALADDVHELEAHGRAAPGRPVRTTGSGSPRSVWASSVSSTPRRP